jgi:hypothetical protein
VNNQEMRAFLGLVMAMGIVKKPFIESYCVCGKNINKFLETIKLIKTNKVFQIYNEVFEKNYRLDTFNRKREHTFMNISTPNLK